MLNTRIALALLAVIEGHHHWMTPADPLPVTPDHREREQPKKSRMMKAHAALPSPPSEAGAGISR